MIGLKIGKRAEETVERSLSIKPDLILLDVAMPEMDGFEACRQIKSINSGIPVIIMTGAPRGDNIRRSIEIDADAYLIKPLEVDKVLTLVRKFLARR